MFDSAINIILFSWVIHRNEPTMWIDLYMSLCFLHGRLLKLMVHRQFENGGLRESFLLKIYRLPIDAKFSSFVLYWMRFQEKLSWKVPNYSFIHKKSLEQKIVRQGLYLTCKFSGHERFETMLSRVIEPGWSMAPRKPGTADVKANRIDSQ
jgi:hypothetical protein